MTDDEIIEVVQARKAGMRIQASALINEPDQGWITDDTGHLRMDQLRYRVHPDDVPAWERIKGEHMGRENRLKEAITSLWAVLKGTGSLTAEDSHDMELMVRSALGVQEGERLAETNLHCKIEHPQVMAGGWHEADLNKAPDLPPLPEKDLVVLPVKLKRPKGVMVFDAWVLTENSDHWDRNKTCYGPEASFQNRSNRYAVKPDTEIARLNGVGFGPCPSRWGWHVLQRMTPQGVGVPEKRPLARDEVGKRRKNCRDIEVWSYGELKWIANTMGYDAERMYRTAAPYGGLPPVIEHTFPECVGEVKEYGCTASGQPIHIPKKYADEWEIVPKGEQLPTDCRVPYYCNRDECWYGDPLGHGAGLHFSCGEIARSRHMGPAYVGAFARKKAKKPTYGQDLDGNLIEPPDDDHEIIPEGTRVHEGEVTHAYYHGGWHRWVMITIPCGGIVKSSKHIRAYARKKYSVLHRESGIKPGDRPEQSGAAEGGAYRIGLERRTLDSQAKGRTVLSALSRGCGEPQFGGCIYALFGLAGNSLDSRQLRTRPRLAR